MGIAGSCIKSMKFVYVNEISKDYKLKLFTMSDKANSGYSNEESIWTILRPSTSNNRQVLKEMEIVCEFSSKVTMNPTLQQVILSTPSCHGDYLTKMAKSSSLLMNNPSIKNRLQLIIEQLVEKLNPAQLKSVRLSLANNVNIIQTPSGTNKILTTVEIVRAWLKYSQFQVLVYSENKMDVDLIHMGLLKTGIRSLC